MAGFSIISKEDLEEQEPLAAAPKPEGFSIVATSSLDVEATAPIEAPKLKPFSIIERAPVSAPIEIGDTGEPGFFGRAFDSFQAWRDENLAERKRNALTREEARRLTKNNIKRSREMFSNENFGPFGFGDIKPVPYSALVRAGLEEPPEDEVENALIDHMAGQKPMVEGRLKKERENWARYPKDPNGFVIDPTRTLIQNEDGTQSSEISITLDMNGRWFNIPSVVRGKQVSQDDAIIDALNWARKGWLHPNFATEEEAVEAAKARSDAIMGARAEWQARDPDEPKKPEEEKEEDPWGTVIWTHISNVPHMWKGQYGAAKMFINAPRDLAYILEAASDQGVAPENSFALEVEAFVQGKDPAEYYGELLKEAANNADLQEGLRINQEAIKYLQGHQPNVNEESIKYYVGAIVSGSLNMTPMLVAAAVTRNPAVGAAIMGGQVFADQYAASIRQGRSHSQATMDGVVVGAAEILTEMVPLGILTKGGGTLLKRMLKAGGAEAIQEPLTQLIQEAYQVGVIDDEMTFGEALLEIITTEEGRAMLKRSAIIGFGVGGTLATAAHPFYRNMEAEDKADPDDPGWMDLPETGPGGKPLKKPKRMTASERAQMISPEEAKALDLTEVDVTVELMERAANADPLTIDEQYTITNNGYGKFQGAEENLILVAKGLQELERLRDQAAGEEIVLEGEEVNIRAAGEVVEITAEIEPDVTPRRATRAEMEFAKVHELFKPVINAMSKDLTQTLEKRWASFNLDQRAQILTTFENIQKLPSAERVEAANNELKALLEQFQAAVQGEPPDEEGDVVDTQGEKIVVWRGEHGLREDQDPEFQARVGSLSFGSLSTATVYAKEPNDRTRDRMAADPRVRGYTLNIKKPFVNSKDDPFIDMGEIRRKLGSAAVKRIVEDTDLSNRIMNTDNWAENFAQEFDSPAEVLRKAPERVDQLYMDLFAILDDARLVQMMRKKGFDGAIHQGMGENFDEIEYRVFDPAQAIRLPEFQIVMEEEIVSEMEVFRSDVTESRSSIRARLEAVQRRVKEPKSPEQAEAGNYPKGHMLVDSIPVTIETRKGGTRQGIDRKGKPWTFKMKDAYGYIKGTESREADGRGGFDQIDVFIGPYLDSGHAVIINQKKDPKQPMSLENFDEHKIMLGYRDTLEAEKAYRRNYTDGGAQMGSVVAMTTQELREWLETANTKTPATLLEVVFVPGRGEVDFRPFQPALDAALAYTEANDIEYEPAKERAKLDAVRAAKIAREFTAMEHAPTDPDVQAAYQAMIEETLAQYEYVLESGLEVEFIVGKDPYTSPRDAILDIRENNHLWVFPTREGFGSRAEFEAIDNPLLNETKYKISGKVALANDIFRVVHDYFGHLANGFGFRARGEENAWQHHAAMYSPLARRAMTVETRGQNSWVNYGPHGETNRTASTADTVYADQKIGLLPVWVSEEGRLSAKRQIVESRRRKDRDLDAPPVSADGRITLTHYSSRPDIDRLNPSFYGQGLRGAEAKRAQARPEAWIDRTYYGIAPGVPGGYRKESGLGPETYTASVDARLLYDFQADPENLAVPDLNELEKAIRDAGYSGYWLKHPTLGLVASVFDPLEVETKKGPSARSRRKTNAGRGLSVSEVQIAVQRVYRLFRTVPPVRVVESIEDLPRHLQVSMEDEHSKRNTTGMYDQGAFNDDIYIIANNLTDTAEAIETLLHEVVGHFGLRQVIPPWRFDEFMDLVAKSFPKQVREIAQSYDLSWDNIEERRVAAEEFIAHTAQRVLAGQTVSQKAKQLLDRVVDALMNAVRWVTGKQQMFTTGQLLSIIAQSSDFVQRPGGYKRSKQRGRLRHVSAPYFFSQVWKAFNDTDTKATTADGWKQFITGQLKQGKMKQTETDWMGLTDGVDENKKIKSTWLDELTWGQLYQLSANSSYPGSERMEDVENLFPEPMFEVFKEQRELGAENSAAIKRAMELQGEAFEEAFPDVQKKIGAPDYNHTASEFRRTWLEDKENNMLQFLPVNEQRDLTLGKERHEELTNQLEAFGETKPKKIPVASIQSYIERNGVDIDVRQPGGDDEYGEPYFDETSPDEETEADEDKWYEHWQEIEDQNWGDYHATALTEVHSEHKWDPDLEADPAVEAEADMSIEELNEVIGDWDGTSTDDMEEEASDKTRENIEEDYYADERSDWEDKNKDASWFSGQYTLRTDSDGDYSVYHDEDGDLGYNSDFDSAAEIAIEHYEKRTAAWKEYMLSPAGEDYQVLLFRWQNPDKSIFEESGHWENEDNFVAHVRFDIRKDEDGNDAIYIDEMQSDWHQAIRDSVKEELSNVWSEHGYVADYDNRDGTFGGGEDYDGTPVAKMYEQAREKALSNPEQVKQWRDKAEKQFKAIDKYKDSVIEEMKEWSMTKDLALELKARLVNERATNAKEVLSRFAAKVDSKAAGATATEAVYQEAIRSSIYEEHGFVDGLSEQMNIMFSSYRELRKGEQGAQLDSQLISREEFDQMVLDHARGAGQSARIQHVTVADNPEWSTVMSEIWDNVPETDYREAKKVMKELSQPVADVAAWDGTKMSKMEGDIVDQASKQLHDEAMNLKLKDMPETVNEWQQVQDGTHQKDAWELVINNIGSESSGWESSQALSLYSAFAKLAKAMNFVSASSMRPEFSATDRGYETFTYVADENQIANFEHGILAFNESKDKYQQYADGQSFAPFEKDWQLLVIKHMIAEAVRRGMKRIYFSKGEVHGVRWHGAETVSDISFKKHPIAAIEQDPTPDLFTGELKSKKQGNEFTIELVAKGGQRHILTTNTQLSKNVGNRVAKLILASKNDEGMITHEDVDQRHILIPAVSGGERLSGSRVIYNQVAVNQVNKFLKKFKGKVKDSWVPGTVSLEDRETAEREGVATKGLPGEEFQRWQKARMRRLSGIEVTSKVDGGFESSIYKEGESIMDPVVKGVWIVEAPDDNGVFQKASTFYAGRDGAERELFRLQRRHGDKAWGYEAWEIEITPKLEAAARTGFPLFHKRGKPKTGDKGLDDALDWASENIGPPGPRSIERLQRRINEIVNIERKQMKLEQALIDQFAGLKWAIRQTHDHELPAQMNAYKQAHFTTSMDSQMYVFLTHGIPVWEEVATAEGTGTITGIKEGSKGLLEVLEPVADKITYWGYWMAAVRADRLLREGREALFTQERVDELMRLGGDPNNPDVEVRFPEFQDVADEYADWKTQFLDWASEAGVINEDTRPLWDSADYVPFYRIKSDEMGGSFAKRAGMGGPGIANVTQPIKRLLGSKHPLGDILENIIVNFQHIATTTMKNKAAQLAVENLEGSTLLVPAPPSAFLKEEFIPMDELKRKLKQAAVDWEAMPDEALRGMQKMWTLQQPPGDNYISVLYNGKKKWFEVREETLLRSLTAINERKFASIMGRFFMWPLRKFKRLGTTMITLAPDFMAANWFRDIFMAFVNSRHVKFPKPWSAAAGFWKAFTKSPEMVSMMAAGGAFYSGYINANDPISTVKAMKRALRQTGFKNRILDTPWKIFHLYNDIGAAAENANRIGSAYIPAMKAGAGKAEAVWEAKDLMNFAKHGDHGAVQFLAQTVMFLNARVQGLTRYAQRFREAPGLTFTKSMLYSMAVLMIWLKNKDDDRYKALPPDEKDMYVHFWTNGKHWRLPKSFEVGMIFGVGIERTFEYYYSNEDDAGKVAIDRMWWVLGEVFNLLGPRFPFVPLPQAIAPLYEATQNWNAFFQSPIVPEYMQDIAAVKPELVFRPTTSPTARELARGLPKWAPAMLRNPMLLEHLTRGYFATLGAYVMMMSDDMVRKMFDYPARPDLRWNKIPVARRFYSGEDPPSRTMFEEVIYQVRQNAKEIERAVNQLEKLERDDEIEAFLEEPSRYDPTFTNEQIVEASKAMKPSYEEMKRIRKEITALWEDEDMGGEQKGRELNELLQEKLEEAKEGWLERPGSSEAKEPPDPGAIIQFEALQDTLIDMVPGDRVDYLAEQGLDRTADLLASLPVKPSTRFQRIMTENSA